MRALSISAAWDEAKAILARDGQLLAAVALALIVLPQVIVAVAGVPIGPQATMLSKLLYIAEVLLGFVAQIALNRLAIGPSVTVKDAISQGLVRLLPVFVALLLVMFALALIVVIIGVIFGATGIATIKQGEAPPSSILLVLIALTVMTFAVIQLIFPIAAVETGNPIRLLTRSWQLARSQYLRLLAFVIIIFVGLGLVVFASQVGIGSVIVLLLGQPNSGSLAALILGLLAGLIQAAFTVVTAVMLARIYLQLAGRGDAQASVPSSGI